MIPQTPSAIVPSDSSADKLLRLGKPFVEFPRYSILDFKSRSNFDFSDWLSNTLTIGKPFVISDFDRLEAWPRAPVNKKERDGSLPAFTTERLIELSTNKNIPIRNCSTGRDLSFTLSKFVESARRCSPEFQNLYARDLKCPQEWLEICKTLLPTEVNWGGHLDLFRYLPPAAKSEVMMAYVGSEGSCSGFHRCFSSTVALNFLVDIEDDRPVVCIGTDFDSQEKYNSFMQAKSISPHLDWHNLGAEEMLQADFPLYVYDQKVGDLVVFPPATAHQIWNPSILATKLVWNMLHPLSLEMGINHVQAPLNRLCHPDVARVNLSLTHAMLSLLSPQSDANTIPDLTLLYRLFRQMVHDETIETPAASTITFVTLPAGTIATCDFCSTAIWNRHVRCTSCVDFDLCLMCYLNGRSCEHIETYTWTELIAPETCSLVQAKAREILNIDVDEVAVSPNKKTVGTAVNDLMAAKKNSAAKLCHLCRIDHPEWKGKKCDTCNAFFCYRGLYRHFDTQPTDILRLRGPWTCPKCSEICNCRCCHFATVYIKSEKPASKRRVKATDGRGRTMGFADNVFDQKRGGKREGTGPNHSMTIGNLAGKKRPADVNGHDGPSTPMRKVEFDPPSAEAASQIYMSENNSEYGGYSNYSITGNHPPTLPGVRSVADYEQTQPSTPGNDRFPAQTPPVPNFNSNNTLPPMLGRSLYGSAHGHGPQSNYSSPSISNLIQHNKNMGHRVMSMPQTQSMFTTNTTRSRPSPPKTHTSANFTNVTPMTGLVNINDHHSHTHPVISTPMTETNRSTVATSSKFSDITIRKLESEINCLKSYDEELIALGYADSRKVLHSQLEALQAQLDARKRERGLGLIERLRKEGFSQLADAVGLEVGVQNGFPRPGHAISGRGDLRETGLGIGMSNPGALVETGSMS